MTQVRWTLPVPSTSLLEGGPVFEKRLGRKLAIRFSYEADDGTTRSESLVFEDVEAFKCTYYRACDPSMLDAYDRLLDRGETAWLNEIKAALTTNGGNAKGLAHLVIMFDDGPCYEVICRSFHLEP